MSAQLGKLCSLLLQEHFGDTVEIVGMDLFRGGQKPLRLICDATKLPVNDVRIALSVLIKYGLACFYPSKVATLAEYKLCYDNIILLLRYPKYLMLMKSLYGNEAEIIIEEILRHGREITLCILFRSYKRIAQTDGSSNIKEADLQRVRNVFEMLINKQYIKRSPKLLEKKPVPSFLLNDPEQFILSKIDIPALYEALRKNIQPSPRDDSIYWEVNFERFHQDLRDDLFVLATARRINQTGGEIMRVVLQQMHLRSDPWASISNPILISELRELCLKSNGDLAKNLEDFLAIMTIEFGGFLRKSQSMNSAYEVSLKHAVIELTWCVLANGVDAKYGSNAARIFRLIREQEFIEQDEIQKKAMLPDKEAKFLTYSLLQSGWIQQHELKKGLQKAGPTKTFYLFYIDFDQHLNSNLRTLLTLSSGKNSFCLMTSAAGMVDETSLRNISLTWCYNPDSVVRMYIETSYKSLYNAITLREQEKADNKCLLEKKQRIDAIVLHLKKEGATDEQVAEIEEMVTPPEHALLEKIHLNVNKVSQAELQIDETLFILELYISLKDR